MSAILEDFKKSIERLKEVLVLEMFKKLLTKLEEAK